MSEEIIHGELTEILHCMYCGKEQLWFNVLDENGVYNENEPISVPNYDNWYSVETDDFLDDSDLPYFLEFCCEDHFNKWYQKLVKFINNDIKKWEEKE